LGALDVLAAPPLAVISLAKRDEEVFLPGRSDPVRLPRRSPALRLLLQARNEAHRFAVTFQRQQRQARTITSALLQVPGVGPTRRRALLAAFGSVQGVREASVEQVAAVPGFGPSLARTVLASLGVPLPPLSSPDPDVPTSP
ncbi:MAG: excinuclease ABC subunit C, partial [Gemmatimonadetes bacterium]|nr:excinuclease ABC subunit C [Gemmatimonadota bacterium]